MPLKFKRRKIEFAADLRHCIVPSTATADEVHQILDLATNDPDLYPEIFRVGSIYHPIATFMMPRETREEKEERQFYKEQEKLIKDDIEATLEFVQSLKLSEFDVCFFFLLFRIFSFVNFFVVCCDLA